MYNNRGYLAAQASDKYNREYSDLIYTGRIASYQAKSEDEMQAVADALSLLANVVLAWNTTKMPFKPKNACFGEQQKRIGNYSLMLDGSKTIGK